MVMSTDLFYCYNTAEVQCRSTWSEKCCHIAMRYGYGICRGPGYLSATTSTTLGTITRECMVTSSNLFCCYTTVELLPENYCQIDVRFEYGIGKEDLGILLIVLSRKLLRIFINRFFSSPARNPESKHFSHVQTKTKPNR